MPVLSRLCESVDETRTRLHKSGGKAFHSLANGPGQEPGPYG